MFPHVQDMEEFELPSLATADKVLDLLVQSNMRSFNNELGLYVHNKLQMRDSVLASYSTPEETRNILRGSDFLSTDIFGPLPESFWASLLGSQGSKLMAKKKRTTRPWSYSRTAPSTSSGPSGASSVIPPPSFQRSSGPRRGTKGSRGRPRGQRGSRRAGYKGKKRPT